MDENRFRRVFDQIAPAPGREAAMLARLLAPERKRGRPMKRGLKRMTAALAAAAVLLLACAFTVLAGLDRRLMQYFGIGEGDAPLVTEGAAWINESHTYGNGWTVQIQQVLVDRYSMAVTVDVSAPENQQTAGDYELELDVDLLDGEGQPVTGVRAAICDQLEEGKEKNGPLSFVQFITLADGGGDVVTGGTAVITPRELIDRAGENPVRFQDEWSCTVDLPDGEPGALYAVDRTFPAETRTWTLDRLYLSPIQLVLEVRGPSGQEEELFSGMPEAVTVRMGDGESLELRGDRFSMDVTHGADGQGSGVLAFFLPRTIDPSQAVSIRLYDETIVLADLTQIE